MKVASLVTSNLGLTNSMFIFFDPVITSGHIVKSFFMKLTLLVCKIVGEMNSYSSSHHYAMVIAVMFSLIHSLYGVLKTSPYKPR